MKYLILLAAGLVGCTDADIAKVGAYGRPGEITCYSGGQVIYKAKSSGAIQTEHQSDGWYFSDAATGKLVRISGTCVIIN